MTPAVVPTLSSEMPKKTAGGPSAKARSAAGGVAARKKAVVKAKLEIRGDSPNALMNTAVQARAAQPWKNVSNPTKVAIRQFDGEGSSPLALAVRFKRTVTGAMLLQAKADPNAADDTGTTVLMEAVMTRQAEIVERLVGLGAKVGKRNSLGKNAIDVCDHEDIRQLLNRKLALDKIPPTPEPEFREADEEEEDEDAERQVDTRPEVLGFGVRLEGLLKTADTETLEKQIRGVMKRCGAPNPPVLKVELDPIKGLPRGHAYAYFLDAAAQDLAMRGHGEEILGQPLRIYKEPAMYN